MSLPQKLVAAAIPDDQDLVTAVQAIVKTHPDITPTITRLLAYIQSKQTTSSSSVSGDAATPVTKQPAQGIAQFFNKPAAPSAATGVGAGAGTGVGAAVDAPIGPAIYFTNPLSFLHPVRKKLVLSLHKSHIALVSATSATDVAFKAPYESLYRVVAVPFLERATKHTALILFFRHSAFASGGGAKDAIWAVPLPDDGKDFSLQVNTPHLGLVGLSQDLRITGTKEQPPLAFVNPPTVTGPIKRPDHIFLSILSYFLKHSDTSKTGNVMDRIIPNPTPAYPNFSAHLKSNQGTIYLLPTGILFAFRKPVLFLRAAAIEAVGIHAVLSRTFDFEVVMDTTTTTVSEGGRDNGKDESRRGATVEDLEGIPPENKDGRRAIGFGMVDTKEFARMEEWIKKAGIRDRSMSEDLKAKDKAPTAAGAGSGKKRERAADGEEEQESSQKAAKGEHDGGAEEEDSDDEDDDDFAPESEDELMEEYDSNAEGSDSDGGGDEETEVSGKKGKNTKPGVSRKSGEKKKVQEDDDVDLDEESLGEDSDEEEDEDEED
ncbi:hypothetical protein BG015_007831 [Linnemannia schmuckeri]|uniref:Histone chaperone RTT106/FACT complex subunit SPT16-like middle domain-containing protein n=1 Tax=Linnemannia schmuckeri TaxID=64567 RepID=A0A9P5VB43_9FUNG|nr:hypothetical protein BG015_007831 [Linnemannia schmuckeri]